MILKDITINIDAYPTELHPFLTASKRYFYSKGLSAEVLFYITDECDWLLTTKDQDEDCTSEKYTEQPERNSGEITHVKNVKMKAE